MTTLSEITKAVAAGSMRRQVDELLHPSPWIKAMMEDHERRLVEKFLSGAPDVGVRITMEMAYPGWPT